MVAGPVDEVREVVRVPVAGLEVGNVGQPVVRADLRKRLAVACPVLVDGDVVVVTHMELAEQRADGLAVRDFGKVLPGLGGVWEQLPPRRDLPHADGLS